MELTQQQQQFFDTFGYLQLPGLLKADMGWIMREFEAVFTDRDIHPDKINKTVIVVPFIDQREKLCTLLDHPAVNGALTGIVGPDFNYLAGDGRYYSGDTPWHPDGRWTVGRFVKIAFYLDPLTRDTGALRVIPGSHRIDGWEAYRAYESEQVWGISGKDVPAIALESQPGDAVIFNHNIMHASFGGNPRRRMFTLNCGKRAETPEEVTALEQYISGHMPAWGPAGHGEIMRRTASPRRMRHLEQVISHESHLPALHAEHLRKMAAAG